jgi:hypothetical protein
METDDNERKVFETTHVKIKIGNEHRLMDIERSELLKQRGDD